MGRAWLCVGFLILGLFGHSCNAQHYYQPTNSSLQAPASTQWYQGRPVATQAPVQARPTFWRPVATQRPVTGRPTFTQGPVTGRPTFTQGPVTGRPTFTQGPVTGRPTFTQGPVTGRPTFTQGPVTGRPTFTQGPVTGRPTKGTTVVEPPLPKPDAVKVECGETSVSLQVDEDLLGIGNLIQASDITLGGCGPIGQDRSYLLFEAELHDCGSTLTMTGDKLVYTFTLNYQPKAIGATPIIRTNGALVGVQCHYMRLHNVSSNALNPTWIPFYSTLSAEDILVFSLRLMAADWRMERASNVFFLGDLINIEASVIQANHVPLRVFMDRCVATLAPDMNSVPQYAFIDDQGCLMDSKLTSSRSKFQSRVTDDKLQVQLDAFRFAQDTRSEMYIFCQLRAVAASSDAEGKACTFLPSNRWVSASGNDEACSCCDTSCNVRRKGRSLEHEATQHSSTAVIGPIVVQPTNDLSLNAPLKADDHSAAGISLVAVVMAGVMVAVGLIVIILLTVLRF